MALSRRAPLSVFSTIATVLAICACSTGTRQEVGFKLERASFGAFSSWRTTDKTVALSAFRRSCVALSKKAANAAMGPAYAGTARDWQTACKGAASATDPTAFFESAFVPYRITGGAGLFTGYYEPEIQGSRTRKGAYTTPLYALPSDLVSVDLGLFRESLKGQRIGGRVVDGKLVPYDSRADIAKRGLRTAKVLLYTDDPVAAFFLQVQGSGRVRFEDGKVMRIAYAGQNGHVYTAIGGVLIKEGALTREDVSLQSIRAWVQANPKRMQELFDKNASYVFFTLQDMNDPRLGASGSQGVPLTTRASIAVDNVIHPLGAPAWIETKTPDGGPLDLLTIAQDTGGAIKGAARADIYFGTGPDAETIAGRMKSQGVMTILLPKEAADRIGSRVDLP
jgi:membrane-bound lytic murein transglycosylase A